MTIETDATIDVYFRCGESVMCYGIVYGSVDWRPNLGVPTYRLASQLIDRRPVQAGVRLRPASRMGYLLRCNFTPPDPPKMGVLGGVKKGSFFDGFYGFFLFFIFFYFFLFFLLFFFLATIDVYLGVCELIDLCSM